MISGKKTLSLSFINNFYVCIYIFFFSLRAPQAKGHLVPICQEKAETSTAGNLQNSATQHQK